MRRVARHPTHPLTRELSPAQQLYLEAFDRFLLAENDLERLEARMDMGVRLNFVLGEVRLPLPERTRWSDF